MLTISITLTALGAAFFLHGFLLHRTEVHLRSGCGDLAGGPLSSPFPFSAGAPAFGGGGPAAPSLRGGAAAPPQPVAGAAFSGGGCWAPAPYARAVLLVVDALRYDFAAPWAVGAMACAPPHSAHCNRMPRLAALLAARPRSARLYRAAADAPTVTLQRVKALATGGLPTFVDVGSNFAGGALREDSWLAQLAARGRAAQLAGDATWAALLPAGAPGSPWRAPHEPVDAFDTRDLHGGDAAVRAALARALNGSRSGGGGGGGWAALVAHAPGLDHVGHTHHAHHAAAAAKLAEVDDLVGDVVAALDGGGGGGGATLLLVAGDHGMTEAGNHGGGSAEEAGAALLAVSFGRPLLLDGPPSPPPLLPPDALYPQYDVAQVDIVPTLALALGLPVPFSSLGLPLPGWDWGGGRAGGARASALVAWAQARFLRAAFGGGADAAVAELDAAVAAWAAAAAAGGGGGRGGGGDAAGRWAVLDERLRAAAGAGLELARARWGRFHLPAMAAGIALLLAGAGAALATPADGAPTPHGAAAPPPAHRRTAAPPLPAALACVPAIAVGVAAVRTWALFTDTFIVGEAALVQVLGCVCASAAGAGAWGGGSGATGPLSAAAFCALGAATAAPPAGWIHAAFLARGAAAGAPAAAVRRPTDGAGAPPPLLLPLASDEPWVRSYGGAALPVLLALPLAPLFSQLLLLRTALAPRGAGYCVRGGRARAAAALLPAAALSLAGAAAVWAHWSAVPLPATLAAALPPAPYGLPRLALALCAAAAVAGGAGARVLSGGVGGDTPLDAALRTSALAQCALLPAAALLLGPWSPPVLLVLHAQGSVALPVLAAAYAVARSGARPHPLPCPPPSVLGAVAAAAAAPAAPAAILLYLFCAHAWGATGHGAQFPALSYGVGLLGWPAFSPWRGGALLAAHTWGVSHGLLAGPAVAWVVSEAAAVGAGAGAGGAGAAATAAAARTPTLLWAMHALSLAAVATLCAVERSHLMVWGVFAPKLCFEVASAAAGAATAVVAAALSARGAPRAKVF
jgi:hypothetical protein